MNGQTLMVPIEVHQITEPNIKVRVPVVSGGTNQAARKKMNDDILKVVHELMKDQSYPNPDIQEMDGTFEVKNNQRGVLSLSLLNYTFTGGAHGNTLQKSLTFDVENGKSYKLSELFKPDSNYKKRLNDIIQAQIKARKLPLLGDYPGISDDQDFYIADKSLVVYFPLYAIVPYAWGFPYFPISVYEIEDIIDENGPLGMMMY
ncbi:DUF3298 and DUF4163 domain-containing protein [Cohnella thailandensis]|uniref:DUF3298 and DUF4163 domain-containing protein n=1 Tax=Cohnella thailandensis TaxID=557557 RepID=A0A841T430_9BACL|nr:DUF3298 and DUF4163 domain-containing protein [Cohnella thailandensis]MBB6637395.1 DUF3298 and DUF4163 domain-containing protein [Cohnella thailandensis]MBP1976724.1 hypothetical protein [Cohnella thailandensis]